MTSDPVTVYAAELIDEPSNSSQEHNPISCDRFIQVHFHSDILDKPFFFHPLLGTIHPDSSVRDLISGQPIDRHSTFAQAKY